jgi:LysR family transcriptional regulator, low CO2-responsive transcriptional regulator
MGRPPKEMATRTEAFAAHPLVFVAPPGHPLLARGPLPASALEAYPLIAARAGSGTRQAMQEFLHEQRASPRITMEMPATRPSSRR